MFRDMLCNYDYLNVSITSTPSKYLIIYFHDEIESYVEDFANWIEQQYNYEAYTYNVNGETADEIREYIKNFWETHNKKLDYVLLVGPNYGLPMPFLPPPCESEHPEGIPSDYFYGCCSGKDLLPEVAVGRIYRVYPYSNLEIQLNKIKSYYLIKQPSDLDWRRRVLLVAHKRKDNYANFEGMCYAIENYDGYVDPKPEFTGIWGRYEPNPNNKDIIKHINEGVSNVLYIGDGNTNRWGHWCINDSWDDEWYPMVNSWHVNHIKYYLTNYYKHPVVFLYA